MTAGELMLPPPPRQSSGALAKAQGLLGAAMSVHHPQGDLPPTVHAHFPDRAEIAIQIETNSSRNSSKSKFKLSKENIERGTTRNRKEAGAGVEKLNKYKRSDQEAKGLLRDNGYWLVTTFAIRGRALPVTLVLFYLLYCIAMTAVVKYGMSEADLERAGELKNAMTAVAGLLGLLLAFRFNNAYARWWEGRRAWDTVFNGVNTIVRVASSYVPDKAARFAIVGYATAFPQALKVHLRGLDVGEDGSYNDNTFLDAKQREALANSSNAPVAILSSLSQLTYNLPAPPPGKQLPMATICNALEAQINALLGSVTTCLTISNTPMPFGYLCQLRFVIYLFLCFVPFVFAVTFGWYNLILCALFGFAWFGVESVSLELESPFGLDYNDLPLNRLTIEIQNTAMQWLAEPEKQHDASPPASDDGNWSAFDSVKVTEKNKKNAADDAAAHGDAAAADAAAAAAAGDVCE